MRKLIYAKSQNIFERKLEEGKIAFNSIVFIEDTGAIWTHGNYFGTNSSTRVAYGEWDYRENDNNDEDGDFES